MGISRKAKIVAGAVAGLAVAGGGGALAATQLGSPKEESQAIVNDAAQQLGVQPKALSDALKKAIENRIDGAVEAGRLTKAQGEELKQRIESGEFPLFMGPPPEGGFHVQFGAGPFGESLGVAASYLGVTESQLRSELRDGKSLAQVAKDHDKSVDGLVQALVDQAKTKLDRAVKAGDLSRSEADTMLADLKDRISDLVNGRFPPMGPPKLREFHRAPGSWN
jgi:hypothetical protein